MLSQERQSRRWLIVHVVNLRVFFEDSCIFRRSATVAAKVALLLVTGGSARQRRRMDRDESSINDARSTPQGGMSARR
jgi:hypothetical protein